jgi:hypothetical protein
MLTMAIKKIEFIGIIARFTIAMESINVWKTSKINLQESPA